MKLQELAEYVKPTFESLNESTIRLDDIYDWHELNDESESLYHYIDREDLKKDFVVQQMSPEQAKHLETIKNDMTVFDSYIQFASKSQKRLVNFKIKHYDTNRIIVIAGDSVVDGNHQVIASILANKPLKYINLDN